MEKHLLNKKVLFIGYEYYNYEVHIKNALLKAGAKVTFYLNVKNKWIYFILRQLSFKSFNNYCHKYGKQILKDTNGQNFDYLFVLHGFQFDDYFYQKLKSQNPNIILINYTWDSIKPTYHKRTQLDIIKHFDRSFSFDKSDCIKFKKQNYLPLFYIDEYSAKKSILEKPKYDLVFIGSLVTYRRYKFIKELENSCKEQNLVFFYYLKSGLKTYLKFLLKGKILKNIKFRSLKPDQIIDIYKNTNVILDIPGQIQSGLTMRTIESLGYGLKLITANEFIKNEAFFNKEFINVISLENPKIDQYFIKSRPANDLNMENYSIHNWLKNLFVREIN